MLKNMRKVIILFFIVLLLEIHFGLTVISENGSIVYYNDLLIGVIKDNSLSFSATFPGLIKVVKPGYLPFEKEITEDGTVVAQLTFPSYLKINVLPENAEIYINDVRYTGGKTYILKPGQYVVKAFSPGLTSKTIELSIKEKEEKVLNIILKDTVTLTINADEIISDVIFDGKIIKVPNILEVKPGKYRFILPTNFAESIQEYDVPPVDSFSVKINTKKKYNLQILGEPGNAYLKLNSNIYKIPFNGDLVEGTYTLVIYAEGYREERINLNLKSDTIINYVLEPENLYRFESLSKDYRVEFDGFVMDKIIRRVYFATIKDKNDNIVWLGFTDGSIKSIPSTIPVLVGPDYQVTVGSQTYFGPAVLHVQRGQKVSVYNRLSGTETIVVDKLTIFDTFEKCLLNVYSKTNTDVFIDGRYIGKTPIYLFAINSGRHEVVLKRNGQDIFKGEFDVVKGKLNEICIDK